MHSAFAKHLLCISRPNHSSVWNANRLCCVCSVRAFNNKVLALAEGGPPVEINPETLDTLNDVKYTSSFFSAHPKIDPDTKSK